MIMIMVRCGGTGEIGLWMLFGEVIMLEVVMMVLTQGLNREYEKRETVYSVGDPRLWESIEDAV